MLRNKFSDLIKSNRKYILIYLIVISLFILNRMGVFTSQSLPYTYDQGRDFQRAANLVENLDPVFIGPTTGIEGIFHGAWWYYYLAIPYILFGGLPLGFYISNLLVHLTSLLLLMYFLFRYFDKKISFLIGVLISTSPYFIFNSIFVGNNIMVLPAMVVFLITHFIIIEFLPKKSWKKALLFLTTGLSLGFIAEFEFAFGLLLAPIYLLLILGINFLRKIFFTRFTFPYLFLGILFAFIPRILFEIKNDFSQTIKLINYFFNPTSFVYKSIQDRFFERVDLFLGFYQGIFFNQLALLVVTPICLFILYVFFRKRRPLIFSKSLTFFTLLVTGLFLISLYYKDNFWNYYYEGLPYIFAFILAIILTSISKIKFPNLNWVLHLTIFIAIFISLYNFIIGLQKENKIDGLAKTNKVVEFIHQNEENLENYCVIIYTPPAIPYTYNYIFYYKERSENIPYPKDGWAENKCWFIIEADSNKERRQSWIKDRIPENSKLLIEKNIEDILIQKREYVNN